MYLPTIELHEAATLEEAAALLGQYAPEARLLAGGTDLLVDLKTGRGRARHLVSVRGIGKLHGVLETKAGLRIGALVTISQLDRSPIIAKRYPAIRDATREMAAPQIRNAATVGGNIAGAVPCADLPPVLMVMNASVVLWSIAGERTVAIEDLFVGPRETILRDEEILTAVIAPHPPDRFGAAYARFALRDGNAIAVAAVAASLVLDSDDTVCAARVALGAVSPTPKLVEAAGKSLTGRALGDDAIGDAAKAAMEAAEPISDIRGSAEYRRELLSILTPRAITTACERAKELRR